MSKSSCSESQTQYSISVSSSLLSKARLWNIFSLLLLSINFHKNEEVVVYRAVVTKFCRLIGFNNRNLFSYGFGGWKFKTLLNESGCSILRPIFWWFAASFLPSLAYGSITPALTWLSPCVQTPLFIRTPVMSV